ncbi:hypothetical protein A7K91_10550 [Paenibacillus oryzae]|uniref:Tissue inhibitor of metalloproteinase n=1 Tax=Paenibacillus oryzae TaxID=1844972 RepID=A0A1A5YRQ8_9BACL|nr:hypothetical protein [Paenibacillus oryzae]OBR68244.1 hypothetical protein A7K91_10550 [Paenibacillus oryzae]
MSRFRIKSLYMLLIFAVAIGLLATAPERAHACSCAMNADVKTSLENHNAVFEGTVTAKKEPTALFFSSSADPVTYTFKVNEVWKGKVAPSITVTSAWSSASCGFEFKEGSRYLVYARDNGKTLEVSLCSRTAAYSSASGDLAELGTGSTPPQPPYSPDSQGGFIWWIIAAAAALFAGAGAIAVYRRKSARRF